MHILHTRIHTHTHTHTYIYIINYVYASSPPLHVVVTSMSSPGLYTNAPGRRKPGKVR